MMIMLIVIEKNRCPLCGFFGEKTREKNIFICPKCEMPFSEFGLSPGMEIENREYEIHVLAN